MFTAGGGDVRRYDALIFWFVAAACVLLVALTAFVNIGAFVLSYRANRRPSRMPLVRGVLGLFVLFVLPRILPNAVVLCLGALLVIVIWELAARMRRTGNRGERPNPVRAPINT